MDLQQQHDQHDDSTFVQNIINSTIVEFSTNVPKGPNLNDKNILWSDLEVDDNGKAKGVRGFLFQHLRSNQMRTICSRLVIKGVKSAKKKEMIKKVVGHHQNHLAYQTLEVADISKNNSPCQQVQCPFLLMNVLFSDMFAPRLATLGNAATRH
jgi:hypothetical protein